MTAGRAPRRCGAWLGDRWRGSTEDARRRVRAMTQSSGSPVAIVIGVGHEIGHRARPRAVRELAGGIEAAG